MSFMKYGTIEGLSKKDPFKQGFAQIFNHTKDNLLKNRIRILPESIGEPAALLDFIDYDFCLAFKTDGTGTKVLIADQMTEAIRRRKKYQPREIERLYECIGIDLVATNVNDVICLGATPLVLSDEIASGHYTKFTDREFVNGLYSGIKKGCDEANITVPCGESPTQVDIVKKNTVNITCSCIGIVKPKQKVILGKDIRSGDAIFGLHSSGIHVNGLSLARKLIEILSKGYFTKFGSKTLGEELLTPTRIYVKPILEMLDKQVPIHYMSNISGSAFRKVSRAKKPFTYVIEQLPQIPEILDYLQKLGNLSDKDMYETWNMGLGFMVIAPEREEEKMKKIAKKYKTNLLKLGYVETGKKSVVIKPKGIIYE